MKKEKKKEEFPWKKVFVIAAGVLFVVMMVLSAMGTSWIQSFRTVTPNDTVLIGYTMRDAAGQAVLTTDQNLYASGITKGQPVFLTAPITVRAGFTGNPAVTGVDTQNYYYNRAGVSMRFGLFGQELDQLDIATLGMKAGETKTIRFNITDPLVLTFKDYEFNDMGGNFSTTRVGDVIPLGLSETPVLQGGDTPVSTPENATWRMGTVVSKGANSLEVSHMYPTADVTVQQIK